MRMTVRVSFVALITLVVGVALGAQQTPVPSAAPVAPPPGSLRPMHVYIRAGLKSHAEGQHDYPQLLADWSKLLTERGAIVDGGLHFPTAQELAEVDVIVMYKGDAGWMTQSEKAVLEDYLKRGGGLVAFHDTICGDDPAWQSTVFGGAKRHGEANFSAGAIKYSITDPTDPIMRGVSGFEIDDEAFFRMTWAENPGIKVLATAPMPSSGEVVPQIWTYQRTLPGGYPFRSFVWMQGHLYANFANPTVLPMLLRGVAWAANYPLDSLANPVVRGRGAGGGRGAGRGGRGGGRGGAMPEASAPGSGGN
jgi:type 1 glutamine amidotransferase